MGLDSEAPLALEGLEFVFPSKMKSSWRIFSHGVILSEVPFKRFIMAAELRLGLKQLEEQPWHMPIIPVTLEAEAGG